MKKAEESIPRHRVEAVTWDSEPEARRRLLNSAFCIECRKLSLRTKVDAHNYIGLLFSRPHRESRPNDHTMAPYRCPHGNGWHVGRSQAKAALLEGK